MAKKNVSKMVALVAEMNKNGCMTTHQCYRWWNERYKYSVTTSRLVNYLAKSGYFVKVGETKSATLTGQTYPVCVWGPKEVL